MSLPPDTPARRGHEPGPAVLRCLQRGRRLAAQRETATSTSFPASSPRSPSSKTSTSRAGRCLAPTATIGARSRSSARERRRPGRHAASRGADRHGISHGPDERSGLSSTMPGGRSASRPTPSRACSTSRSPTTSTRRSTRTNPFAFLSQAKQFSLAINAELPLVRINERNAFRTALINLPTGTANAANRGRQSENPVAQ